MFDFGIIKMDPLRVNRRGFYLVLFGRGVRIGLVRRGQNGAWHVKHSEPWRVI